MQLYDEVRRLRATLKAIEANSDTHQELMVKRALYWLEQIELRLGIK